MTGEYQEETLGTYEKAKRKYTRRGGRTRGRGRKRGRPPVMPHRRLDSRAALTKESQLGSYTNVVVRVKQDSLATPRSSTGNGWGHVEPRTAYVDEEESSNASQSQSEENNLVSGYEYDDQAPDYSISYGQNRQNGLLDGESDEDDVDEYEEVDAAHIGRAPMDADFEEEELGDVNGDDDDDYSSEYSDE